MMNLNTGNPDPSVMIDPQDPSSLFIPERKKILNNRGRRGKIIRVPAVISGSYDE
jgi:hypothetical protein